MNISLSNQLYEKKKSEAYKGLLKNKMKIPMFLITDHILNIRFIQFNQMVSVYTFQVAY